MKIIFRGYGPTTEWETFERVENWDFRPNYNDVVEIAGVLYTISRIVIDRTKIIINVRPEQASDNMAFDKVSWYPIENNSNE